MRFIQGIYAISLALTAQAANFSFQGQFSAADMVSLAYCGGTNSTGTLIPPGGFDTFFTLFAADGSQINTNDDGGCGSVNSGNGGCLDACCDGIRSSRPFR
jgi:hypothetical protein